MKGKIIPALRALRDLTLMRFPSKSHKVVWKDYETILMYRSIMSQLSRILMQMAYMFMGQIYWMQSEKYVATGEPKNHELAVSVQSYAQIAFIV